MIWDELTSTQLAAMDKNIPVLLVLSATEQHGPHLPLATDRLIGVHFAETIHQRLVNDVLLLPPLPIGCSFHHMSFAGTLSLSHNTFSNLIREIIESVIKHGFYKIILLNSHGGNQAVMQVTIEQLGYDYPFLHLVGVTWWIVARDLLREISDTGKGGTGHACEFETSLVEFIAGHLIVRDKIGPGTNIDSFKWAEGDMLNGARASYYRSMEEITLNGVYGNPTHASYEKGLKITESVTESLIEIIKDLKFIKPRQ